MIVDADADSAWMRAAIAAAWRAGPEVRPNPRVGCALVRDGVVVGLGHHGYAGGPHAEVVALSAAGAAARGATAYVTLEPCNHHGRTPPCVDALLAAGVARVVCALRDPNPIAAGGLARLASAGVAVDAGVEAEAATALIETFLVHTQQGRAHLRLKMAATLDGFTAAVDGSSQWISGAASRRQVHLLRAEVDAVLVGSGTACADDPGLDVRLDGTAGAAAGRKPLRVVLDRRLRLGLDAALCDPRRGPTRVYTAAAMLRSAHAASLRARGVVVDGIEGADADAPGAGADDAFLHAVLVDLARRGATAVLCEGGATLAASLWRAGLVDRLDLFLAPKLLGEGRGLWPALAVTTLADAQQLHIEAVDRLGDDLYVRALPRRGGDDVHRHH